MAKIILPLDANGKQFSKPALWLEPKEYSKIYSEINQLFYSQYNNQRYCFHPSFWEDGNAYIYWFENHGFNNYNIYNKTVDNH